MLYGMKKTVMRTRTIKVKTLMPFLRSTQQQQHLVKQTILDSKDPKIVHGNFIESNNLAGQQSGKTKKTFLWLR